MANALTQAGSQSSRAPKYVPIYSNRFWTGLWTQRNPLRDAATPFLYEKYGSSRYEALIGGLNVELSNRLTIQRRPGHSLYNSQTFNPINSFYSFRQFSTSAEAVKVIADTAATVWDATGPSTKTAIFNKAAGAGQTYFQSVGNTLYMGDGKDLKQWDRSLTSWATLTTFAAGTYIIDSNGRGQVASVRIGAPSDITSVQITNNVITLTFGSPISTSLIGQQIRTGNAFVTPTYANNQYLTVSSVATPVLTANFVHANAGPFAEANTAQAFTGSGISANVQPTWGVTAGATVVDGSLIWTCTGSLVQTWGITAPISAPILSGTTTGTGFWRPNTSLTFPFFIVDPNGNFQALLATGVTGPAPPAWSRTVSQATVDGSTAWFNAGKYSTGWQAATATPYTTSGGGEYCILDSNSNVQQATTAGTTGATVPVWNVALGGTTADNTVTWTNRGSGALLNIASDVYVYAYHTFLGGVSSASPASTLPPAMGGVIIQGTGSADPQVDQIWLFRTLAGGSLPLFVGAIANPGASTWTFKDNMPDALLNIFFQAPLGNVNDPPAAGLINLTYHLGRIWGSVANVVYCSGGPLTLVGNGNEAFPPANNFVFPSKVTRLWPLGPSGLLVFTVSDVYIIPGLGTTTSPFYAIPFLFNLGLLTYNAFDVNGSIIYMMTADKQLVELNPATGVSEIGFPIGDLFDASFDPSTAYVTWHVAGSTDKALYAADGALGWFRMNPTTAPESGISWSPFAQISGGCNVVQSIEVTPGTRKLLLGPTSSGQILQRDTSVFSDNGTPYVANFTIGSIVLAQPGDLGEVAFITTECKPVGSHPTVSIMTDEIGAPGTFASLPNFVSDPPELTPSTSLFSDRWYLSQNKQPALCRHLQLKIAFPAEAAKNELLSYTIYGRHLSER